MADIMKFLDEMEMTRDIRYVGWSGSVDRYFEEWNTYMDEWEA